MVRSTRFFPVLVAVLLGFLLVALPVVAQESLPASGLSGQSLRPYRFVFIAYALAWALVLGWVVAVARRLGRLERQLEK
jgi:CcmD family protein